MYRFLRALLGKRAPHDPPSLEGCLVFAGELEALRRGELPIETLWKRHASDSDMDFQEVLGFVEHWVADDDIRADDPDYRRTQETEFDRLLALLRSGQIDEAKHITFLGT
jgi:hypothetical protein